MQTNLLFSLVEISAKNDRFFDNPWDKEGFEKYAKFSHTFLRISEVHTVNVKWHKKCVDCILDLMTTFMMYRTI